MGTQNLVLKRSGFAWLVSGKQRIRTFELNEYELNGCGTNTEVLQVLDINEEFEAEMAAAICHQWNKGVVAAS